MERTSQEEELHFAYSKNEEFHLKFYQNELGKRLFPLPTPRAVFIGRSILCQWLQADSMHSQIDIPLRE